MAETHRVLGLESYHYCDAQDDNHWMDHMAVRDCDQLMGDAKEKEKLSAGAVVIRSGSESRHETNMDVRKCLQLEEDAQEKEKMTESGEYDWGNDWGNDLGVGLDIGSDVDLDIDPDSNLVVDLGIALEGSEPLQTDQHLWQGDNKVLVEIWSRMKKTLNDGVEAKIYHHDDDDHMKI